MIHFKASFPAVAKETFFTPEALSQGNYPFFPYIILQAHGLKGCRSRSFWLNDMDGLEKAEAASGLAYFRFQYNFLLSMTQFHNPVIFIIFFTGLLLSSKLVSSVR